MSIKQPSEGEALLLLVKRSKKTNAEIAKMLDIHPNHLSKLFKSEKLTIKVKQKAALLFGVDVSVFEGKYLPQIPGFDFEVDEPEIVYNRENFGDMTAADAMRYLEEKDKRHYEERERHFEERARLLGIIENLTKSK